MRRGKNQHETQLEASDVIAGRVRPDARRVIELIHRINPTAIELPAPQMTERYALKARLQSLLVTRFRDDLRVEPSEHGIVLLRHQPSGRDACHAKLVELDEEARAWVQAQLDLGDDEPAATTAAEDAPPPPADDAIRLGRAALAEYDYPAAQAHFDQALEASRGAPEAAVALLELLVDHLAQDEDALAVEPRLDGEARAAPEVRLLLAIAAARRQERAQARRHVRGLSSARAAEVWILLAGSAFAAGDLDEAGRSLDEAGAIDPGHPELLGLRDTAARLRAEARRPLEDELRVLFDTGQLAAAEERARLLLERWPDSGPARRVIERIEEGRRAAQAAALLADAAAALEAGRTSVAAERLRQAEALGAGAPELAQRIARARGDERRRAEDERVAQLLGLLDAAAGEAALTAYLEVEPPLRARVRAAGARPILDWLEEMEALRPGRVVAHKVKAALALARATDSLAAGAPELVGRALEPHLALLDGVRHARAVAGRAQLQLDERRRAAAEQALEAATSAWLAGDLDSAEAELRAVDVRALAGDRTAAVDDLAARIRRRRVVAAAEARADERLAAGDPLGAARELGAAAEPLRERIEAVRALIRKEWRVRCTTTRRALDAGDPLGAILGELPFVDHPSILLTPGGDRMLVAGWRGPRLFVAVVDLAGRCIERVLSLLAPEPMAPAVTTSVDGDSLWTIGPGGRALELSWATGDIRRFSSLAPFVVPGSTFEEAFVLPGTRIVWMELRDDARTTARVIDLDHGRVVRDIDKDGMHQPLLGGAEVTRMITASWDRGATIHAARGQTLANLGAQVDTALLEAAVHPSGEGLIVLAEGDYNEDESERELVLLEVLPGRQRPRRHLLPGSREEGHLTVATALDLGITFFVHDFEDGRELRAYHVVAGELALAYAIPVSAELTVVQDEGSRRAVALVAGPERVEVALLGSEPPVLPPGAGRRRPERLPRLRPPFFCGLPEEGTIGHQAEDAARRGEWGEVRALLDGPAALAEAPASAKHVHHLLGLALLHLGDAQGARRTWEAAVAPDDDDQPMRCELRACLMMTAPMPEPLLPEHWDATQPLSWQLRGAIAVADDRLVRGDAQGALAALRRPAVTCAREVQSLARLAEAHLRLEPDDPWDRELALASFLAVLDEPDRPSLPLGAATWDAARLATLAAAARAWLDELA